ncbi:MAG: isochorismatase family protein, partial [Ensifer adhaerens]
GGRQDIALVEIERVPVQRDLRVGALEFVRPGPVRRGRPAVEQAGFGEHEGAEAEAVDLGTQLRQAGVDTLVMSGLMTHACVAGAARDAVPLGFNVIVASDACATRDLDTGEGDVVPHALLHRASLATIDDTFGDILTTDQVLALARRS